MKKTLALVTVSALMMSTLAGCGGTVTSSSTTAAATTAAQETTANAKVDKVESEAASVADTSADKDFSGVTLNFAMDLGTDANTVAVTESLIDAYEEATGITIDFKNISEDYRTWLATQFSANQGPDVYNGILYDMTVDYNAGYLYNFADLYEEESAYDPGKAWKETLPESILERMYVAEGTVPGIPTTSQVVRIFYNADMFKEAGCEVPATWAEYMEVCQKLKDTGYIPFGFPNASKGDLSWLWFCNSISNQLNHAQLAEHDISGNGYVELNEMVKAFEEGKLDFTSEPLKEGYQLMADFSQFWTSDYNGLDQSTAYDMFMRGEVAMVQGMSTNMTNFAEGSGGEFEIGVMPVPMISEETSQYSYGQSVVLGGQPDIIFGINKSCEGDEKKLEAAIDFVQYLASPEVQLTLCDAIDRLPLANSTELPERLKGFIIVEDALRTPYYTGVNNEWRDYFQRGGQMLLEGSLSLDDYCEYLNESFDTVCEQLMTENGWSAENNYGIAQ